LTHDQEQSPCHKIFFGLAVRSSYMKQDDKEPHFPIANCFFKMRPCKRLEKVVEKIFGYSIVAVPTPWVTLIAMGRGHLRPPQNVGLHTLAIALLVSVVIGNIVVGAMLKSGSSRCICSRCY